MEVPLVSVIVPTYNDNDGLRRCLAAIANSDVKPLEVIVVDDASQLSAEGIVREFGYRFLRLNVNSGQAHARNVGAEVAVGEILFFVDSDVVVRKDTIGMVARAYDTSGMDVYQGLASNIPVNEGFGPKLMALKWHYMLKDTREASFVHSHLFSIRKRVFDEVGGFDPSFRPPGGGEEFELGHRLRNRYVIHTDPELLAEHTFPSVIGRARALYHRTYVWARLFARSGRFEKTNASFSEAMTGVLNVATLLALVLIPLDSRFLFVMVVLFIGQVAINWGFYRYLTREAGFVFMLRGIFPNMLWSLVQMTAACRYYLDRITGRVA